MAAIKLQRQHKALSGIESKNHFLSNETLLQLVGSDSFESILKKYRNERLRSFRDKYREFDHKITKLKDSEKNIEKRRKLLNEWFLNIQSYFGYANFIQDKINHWEEGTIPFLRSDNNSHSVSVLNCNDNSLPMDLETSGYYLTTLDGNTLYKSSKKETLSEQVERFIKDSGSAEVILFLPQSAYYFRAESKTASQYLEINWDQILLDDNDDALSLATHICHADFFSYSLTTTDESNDEEHLDAESTEEEEEESSSSGVNKTPTTLSSSLFKEDLEQARKITEELHNQVTLALEILINERLDIDNDLKKKAQKVQHNEHVAHDLFKDGLFVLYRVLFILYAESKKFLPVENEQYASFYSMEHLRNWAEEFLKKERQGLADSDGTYLWGAFRSLFTLLRRGIELKGGESVSAFNGQLFAPDQSPMFDEGPELRDKAVAQALIILTKVGGLESGRRLHFANLGVEQLGAVYEALLAQKPVIVREKSTWVPAHGGGLGLVTEKLADALEMPHFENIEQSLKKANKRKSKKQSAGDLTSYISPFRPGFTPDIGKFIIAPLGGQKRQTASFYTPTKLSEFLVKRTLKPQVEGKSSKEILALRIVEGAVGSGGFLISAMRYLGEELLKAKIREKKLSLRGRKPEQEDLQICKREILENCLFGVDLNPLSLELCRTSLYLEALVKNQPLPFLHHHLKSGNSLIYADFLQKSQCSWDGATEFPSLFNIFDEALNIEKKIYEAWDKKQEAFKKKPDSENIKKQVSDNKSILKKERNQFISEEWADWAIKSQNQVNEMLQLTRKYYQDFDKIQNEGTIVDDLDLRHKDRLAWIPDLDDVLIEAEGIEVNFTLEEARKKALVREHGISGYNQMVRHQRAFSRLKALGDLWCSQWFWPIDQMKHYPTLTKYKELTDYLLNTETLDRTKEYKSTLSKEAKSILKIVMQTAKEHKFFQWNVEFAQIFADTNYGGFTNLISNPPWKVVGVKDKDVYPEYDPQFLSSKTNLKSERIHKLSLINNNPILKWYTQNNANSRLSKLWQHGLLSPLPTNGKIDLAVLFTLAAERLVSDKNGRIGLLVSRSTVFNNKGTIELRKRFFKEWGLQEAITLVNNNLIFEIASYLQFTCIVGQLKKKSIPKFVHGIIDLNLLDHVDKVLDNKTKNSIHEYYNMDINDITYFSQETLSIPAISSNQQIRIAKAIHQTSGNSVYLKDISCTAKAGLDRTASPKKGITIYSENKNKSSNLFTIPVVKGRDFSRFFFNNKYDDEQLASNKYFEEIGIPIKMKKVAWRAISRATDQRTLICAVIPENIYHDQNVYSIFIPNKEYELAFCLGSLPLDFISKFSTGGNRSLSEIQSLPLANYKSGFLEKGVALISKNTSDTIVQAQVDALSWLHYGFLQPEMSRENLIWALDYQFDTLKRNSPDYVEEIIKYYDEYSKDKSLHWIDENPLFKLKADNVVDIKVKEAKKSKSTKKKKRA